MRVETIILKKVGPFDNVTISLPSGQNPNLADVYLLTGPNGSGKSTVLYALAGLIGCGHGNLGLDLGERRLRSLDSVSALSFDGARRASAWRTSGMADRNILPDPFGGGTLQQQTHRGTTCSYYMTPGKHPIHEYWQRAHNFQVTAPIGSQPRFSWAAFAYAGMRSVSDANVTAIQEPTYSPFESSLSFTSTANSDRLAQWIANQDFKRLKAKEAGRLERAAELEKSIRDIELVVSKIIGEEFAFVLSDEDNNVRARRNGIVVELGLLPDGLKSIVSWIADLLMRLDRIPWQDNIPTLQRPFLLLLDEVDIHLHPLWQRKVLPIVQQMFPKAQIIASTHSPFVVASAEDAQVIAFQVTNGVSSVESISPSQSGVSYSAVLRSIFGIQSEFDLETERLFKAFHHAKGLLLAGSDNRAHVQDLAEQLATKSEEVRELIAVEMRQIDRQLQNSKA